MAFPSEVRSTIISRSNSAKAKNTFLISFDAGVLSKTPILRIYTHLVSKVKGDFTMIYGYSRVSTKGQAKDGNSLESQEKALREAGATKIFTDAFTGTKTDRPEFDKLIAEIKAGDTLVVTKLDRFARSMSQGSELVSELIDNFDTKL